MMTIIGIIATNKAVYKNPRVIVYIVRSGCDLSCIIYSDLNDTRSGATVYAAVIQLITLVASVDLP